MPGRCSTATSETSENHFTTVSNPKEQNDGSKSNRAAGDRTAQARRIGGERGRRTYRLRTQRVTWRPFSRHFSGLGSFFLQLRKATFSGRHRTAMCFDAAISTDDVGIGSPEASTGVLLADIAAGAVVSAGSWSWRSGGGSGRSETATPRREGRKVGTGGQWPGGEPEERLCHSLWFLPSWALPGLIFKVLEQP